MIFWRSGSTPVRVYNCAFRNIPCCVVSTSTLSNFLPLHFTDTDQREKWLSASSFCVNMVTFALFMEKLSSSGCLWIHTFYHCHNVTGTGLVGVPTSEHDWRVKNKPSRQRELGKWRVQGSRKVLVSLWRIAGEMFAGGLSQHQAPPITFRNRKAKTKDSNPQINFTSCCASSDASLSSQLVPHKTVQWNSGSTIHYICNITPQRPKSFQELPSL